MKCSLLLQSQLISCAQRKDEVLTGSGPVTYLLDYAASLGITKDITQTQAYSVWLQGAAMPGAPTSKCCLQLASSSLARVAELAVHTASSGV